MFLLRDTHDHCDRRDHNNNNNIALTFTVCREKDSKSDLILISIGQVTAALRKKTLMDHHNKFSRLDLQFYFYIWRSHWAVLACQLNSTASASSAEALVHTQVVV